MGVTKTHSYAPRVIIANSNLVPKWSNWEYFNKLEEEGLMMYGQMTAGVGYILVHKEFFREHTKLLLQQQKNIGILIHWLENLYLLLVWEVWEELSL